MSVSPARAAAFDILLRVEDESSYASELLHSAAHAKLSTADHALATELVMGVLRWRSQLDAQIGLASSQPLAKLDVEILIALRLALYQFQWLDRVPQRAALHESVELVKRARKRSAAAFVNAVLRKLSAATRAVDVAEIEASSPEELGRTFGHPQWMVERWSQEYGLAAAQAICRDDQTVSTTSIRLRASLVATEIEAQLRAEGIALTPGRLLASARQVENGDITKTRAYRSGEIAIQDEGSQLVATLIGSAQTGRILDCCAAPGGKTLAIADQNPEALITAVELHPHRTRLLRRLVRPRAAGIQMVTADVRRLPMAVQFDRVLADVPCSGTGTLGRNPEIKWRLTPGDLLQLQQRQLAILRAALEAVAPGGRLIYSTCSLEREENEDVVEQITSGTKTLRVIDCGAELERLKATGDLWPEPASLTRAGYLRTIPGIHPCDGFFAAILEKI